jgi:hypothetical protein
MQPNVLFPVDKAAQVIEFIQLINSTLMLQVPNGICMRAAAFKTAVQERSKRTTNVAQ